jgi:2-isopropylmalate synthase
VGGEIVTAAGEIGVDLGIHAHNDTGCAVANTLAAVDAGAMHVQGTVNGYGERTGNAELVSVVANLELKYGWPLLPAGSLREATRLAPCDRRGDERATQRSSALCWPVVRRPQGGPARQRDQGRPQPLPAHRPGAGRQRHAHAGVRHGRSGEHPDQGVGAGFDLSDRDLAARITDRVKDAEAAGYTYEAADASFELLLRRELGQLPEYFTVHSWRVFTQATHVEGAPATRRPTPSAPCG